MTACTFGGRGLDELFITPFRHGLQPGDGPCGLAVPGDWPLMLTAPTEVATLDGHRDFRKAVPTADHFIPALYLAGLAGASATGDTDVLVDGYAYGSLSMTAYTLGLPCPDAAGHGGSPRPPTDLPPDGSNI